MINDLRDLFPEDISDETAYHMATFLYALAVAFESANFGKIRRHDQFQTDLGHELMELAHQNSEKIIGVEEEPQDDIF